MGYIIGIADALAGGAAIYGWRACFDIIKSQQALDVVKQWLQNHPETRHRAAAYLAAKAFAGAFPCPK